MQNRVFVLDTNKKPLSPCHPARARELLKKGKAAVYRCYPFTIILNEAKPDANPASIEIKIDPGSKTTGIVLVQGDRVIWAAELEHRGQVIHARLDKHRAIRRSRRNRKTRYRKPGFRANQNASSKRPQGWLAPSLKSRVDNLRSWFVKLSWLAPISTISMELVRFDTQLMENAEMSGVEYQQGELQGYEAREYLLEKFNRKCAYCGASGIPLEIEHIMPRSRGGSNRASNLTLACQPCNIKKGNMTAAEFGHPEIQALAKKPLRDAAAVNSVRWATFEMLKTSGLPVLVGTGGRTKFNRISQGYPKKHWIDAACVGKSGQVVKLNLDHQPLLIKAMGRGTRQMCCVDKYGFPRTSAKAAKRVQGFQTGDLVKAVVPSGKRRGVHTGRIAVRARGSFRVGTADGISYRHCHLIQHVDGYDYRFSNSVGPAPIPPHG